MKSNFSPKVKSIIAFGLMIISVLGLIFWFNVGQQKFVYKTVIQAAVDIPKGTVITDAMLKEGKVEDTAFVKDAIKDKKEIIGFSSIYDISINEQFTKKSLDNPGIVLNQDQKIFKVPKDWIITFPSSIRRKDKAYFYVIDSKVVGEVKNLQQPVNVTVTPTNGTNVQNGFQMTASTGTKDVEKYIENFSNPYYTTTVVYVKDSANREIVDVGTNDNNKGERYDGSSQADSLEIVVTVNEKQDDIKILETAIKNGYRFIVLYN
jgi:hypothetical protein